MDSGVVFGASITRFVLVETHEHVVRAHLRPCSGLALFPFALISALSFVFLFLLARVFLLAFGECGSASG